MGGHTRSAAIRYPPSCRARQLSVQTATERAELELAAVDVDAVSVTAELVVDARQIIVELVAAPFVLGATLQVFDIVDAILELVVAAARAVAAIFADAGSRRTTCREGKARCYDQAKKTPLHRITSVPG